MLIPFSNQYRGEQLKRIRVYHGIDTLLAGYQRNFSHTIQRELADAQQVAAESYAVKVQLEAGVTHDFE